MLQFFAVSDPSLDFVLLVQLPDDSPEVSGSRLDLQRCARSEEQKLVAQATFVPGCVHETISHNLPDTLLRYLCRRQPADLQRCARGDGQKPIAQATFVPRCAQQAELAAGSHGLLCTRRSGSDQHG